MKDAIIFNSPLVKELILSLNPFAEMDRTGDIDLDEHVVSRGHGFERTILTSREFRDARLVLEKFGVMHTAEDGYVYLTDKWSQIQQEAQGE